MQNKFTTLKQAYLDAFNSEEIGGSNGIVDAFKPTAFTKRDFFKLMAKMLPVSVDVEHSGNVSFELSEKFLPKVDDGQCYDKDLNPVGNDKK